MKKTNSLFLGLITLALLSSSCSKKAEDGYPSNPTNGQVYRDSNGNNSTWNALMGYWMISSMMNGRQTQHYYYPSSGEYHILLKEDNILYKFRYSNFLSTNLLN